MTVFHCEEVCETFCFNHLLLPLFFVGFLGDPAGFDPVLTEAVGTGLSDSVLTGTFDAGFSDLILTGGVVSDFSSLLTSSFTSF